MRWRGSKNCDGPTCVSCPITTPASGAPCAELMRCHWPVGKRRKPSPPRSQHRIRIPLSQQADTFRQSPRPEFELAILSFRFVALTCRHDREELSQHSPHCPASTEANESPRFASISNIDTHQLTEQQPNTECHRANSKNDR